jgi:hypothetical protein
MFVKRLLGHSSTAADTAPLHATAQSNHKRALRQTTNIVIGNPVSMNPGCAMNPADQATHAADQASFCKPIHQRRSKLKNSMQIRQHQSWLLQPAPHKGTDPSITWQASLQNLLQRDRPWN